MTAAIQTSWPQMLSGSPPAIQQALYTLGNQEQQTFTTWHVHDVIM